MSKKAQRLYKKMIDEAASKIVIDANREAFKITEGVFADILLTLREKIDEILERKSPTSNN